MCKGEKGGDSGSIMLELNLEKFHAHLRKHYEGADGEGKNTIRYSLS